MQRFVPSDRLLRIPTPPVEGMMRRIGRLRAEGRPVFGMAQATPWFPPPGAAIARLRESLADPAIHRYSPDPGLPEVLETVADDFRRRRSIDLDPRAELHLTCGASQAFLGALLASTSPGDRVAVLEPYYFDHVFAIRFSGLEAVAVPMIESDGAWRLPAAALERILSEVAAVVVVDPGNPTGAVVPDDEMARLVQAAEACGTFLIIDETYERFRFTGGGRHPWAGARRPGVLTVGSFSKSLGIPGWRLGYLFGDGEILAQALKVQDSVAICAPVPAQRLLGAALGEAGWIEERADGIRRRRDLCRAALLGGTGDLEWRQADGAFFTLAAYPGGMASEEAAVHVLEEYGIGTLPGSAFGPAGEGHLRVSFGCLQESELREAMDALSRVRIPPRDPGPARYAP